MERDPLSLDDNSVAEGNELLVPKNENINNFEPIPIVYTTKLDDMMVFKMDVDLLNSDNIVDCIIMESKPKLMHLNKTCSQRKSETSFDNMVQILYKINNKTQENYKSFHNRKISKRSVQKNKNISEEVNPVSKRRRKEINSQLNTETTDGDVTCTKTIPIEMFNKEIDCEVLKTRKQCDFVSKRTIRHNIVEPRQETRPQLETETTVDKEKCIKVEPLEISEPDCICEILEKTAKFNPNSKTAIKRKINRQERNSRLTTEGTCDTIISTQKGPLEVCNTGNNSDPTEKRTTCSSNSSVSLKRKIESIQEYNFQSKPDTLVASDIMSEKQKELLKMCKPVSVVLEDITDSAGCIKLKYESNTSTNAKITVKDKPDPFTFVSIDLNKNLYNKFLLCYDEFSNELDMYYINGIGHVKDYYRLAGDQSILNRTVLLPYIGDQDAVLLLCCCWYQRYQTIKTMWPRFISFTTSKFLIKQHKCVPGNCICCCQNENKETSLPPLQTFKYKDVKSKNIEGIKPIPSATTQLKINDMLSSIEDNPVPTEDNEIEDLEKEISSTITQMQEKMGNEVVVEHKNIWLRELLKSNSDSLNLINKALTYTKQKPNNNEATLKPYIKPLNESSFAKVVTKDKNEMEWYELTKNGEVLEYTKRNTNLYSKLIKSSNMCCWIRRDRLISMLNFDLKEGAKRNRCPAVKFMRRPHLCPLGNCRCCCLKTERAYDISAITPLLNIILPKRAASINSATLQLNNKDVGKIIPSNPVQETMLNSSPKPINILPKPVTVTIESQGVVDSLITTILDTFKDVRLTITEDGKVAAALQKPVNSLSTAELKVLSNILSHAQEQVQSLGLRPGTCLNNHIMMSNVSSQTTKTYTEGASDTASVKSNNAGICLNTPILAPFNSSSQSLTHSNLKSNEVDKSSNQRFLTTQLQTNPKSCYVPKVTPSCYDTLSKIYGEKSRCYLNSFKSHLNISKETLIKSYINKSKEPTETVIPRIANVFSLQDEHFNSSNENDNNLSALKSIWDKNEKNTNVTKSKFNKNEMGVKSVQNNTSTQTKIRVLSPSKLGVSDNPDRNVLNLPNNPIQLQTMNSVDSDGRMIPDHIIAKDLAIDNVTKQSSLVRTACDGSVQIQTQANSHYKFAQQINQINIVNTQLSQNDSLNNFHMIPLANNMQLLSQTTQINTGDIPLVKQTNEVGLEELDIPEFRITKPTRSSAKLVSKPSQQNVNDGTFLSTTNLQILQQSNQNMPTPIVHVGVPSDDITLTNKLNATPQYFINQTIDQVFNSSKVPNTRLEKLLLAPRRPIRLEERALIPKVFDERDQSENSKTETKGDNAKIMVFQNEHDKDVEASLSLSDIKNKEDSREGNIFYDVGDGEINDVNENNDGDDKEDECILGV